MQRNSLSSAHIGARLGDACHWVRGACRGWLSRLRSVLFGLPCLESARDRILQPVDCRDTSSQHGVPETKAGRSTRILEVAARPYRSPLEAPVSVPALHFFGFLEQKICASPHCCKMLSKVSAPPRSARAY